MSETEATSISPSRDEISDAISDAFYGNHADPSGKAADAVLALMSRTDEQIEAASKLMYEDEREWYGNSKWPTWVEASELVKNEMRRSMRAAFRVAGAS